MTPMFNGRSPFIFFIESLKERDTSRFNIKVFEDHMHRNKVDMEKRIQKFKELGIAFYTKKRLKKMDDSLSR